MRAVTAGSAGGAVSHAMAWMVRSSPPIRLTDRFGPSRTTTVRIPSGPARPAAPAPPRAAAPPRPRAHADGPAPIGTIALGVHDAIGEGECRTRECGDR